MFFKIPVVIAELSRSLTLMPGDIIATGTPSGVGYSRKPPEFLKPGDVMETQITGIGIIRKKISEEKSSKDELWLTEPRSDGFRPCSAALPNQTPSRDMPAAAGSTFVPS